uniref:Uncharacterized protein n=1 Tax=Enterobacter cloacae TaxID=550 RepID=A0A0G3AZ47_ENTCL|nr:hypothetical protein [Enterobacter cloacae]
MVWAFSSEANSLLAKTSAGNGLAGPRLPGRYNFPFGPGNPILQPAVPDSGRSIWNDAQHEPQRELLG